MSYLVLYRKYRPQIFKDVVGQKIIIQTLKNTIRYQKINHCYLFSGNKGTGKTTLAKIFAKAINCMHPKLGDVCEKCQSCLNCFQANTDIVELDGASYNGVDEIRELQDKVQYKPHIGKYKVYIVDEVHVLTPNAFNALLKILEEPPKHVVFLLITTEIYKIPETILSRAQSFSFENLSLENIILQLKKITILENIIITDDAIKVIASYADGSMRNALSLLDQISSYQNNLITSEDIAEVKGLVSGSFLKKLFHSLMTKKTIEVLKLLDKAFHSGKNLDLLVFDLIDALKNYLLEQIENTQVLSPEKTNITNEVIAFHVDFILKTLIKLQQDLKKSDQKKILIEIAFLQICYFAESNQNSFFASNNKQPLLRQNIDEKTKVNFNDNSFLDNHAKPRTNIDENLISTTATSFMQNNIYSKKEQKETISVQKDPYFVISSLNDLIMIALNILSNKDESKIKMIANAWEKLNTEYRFFSNRNVAQLLYKGQIIALSHKKEMILVYRDNIACQQILKKNIKVQALKILNRKTQLVRDYVCFLEKDYKNLETFLKNNSSDAIDIFINACDWELDFYKTQNQIINLPFVVQLAYDFFDNNIVEIIN
ncbi:DNA polymerase III subunits gamma and tau [Candidatus Phytoplasma solani]